jgi:hypothetical protein
MKLFKSVASKHVFRLKATISSRKFWTSDLMLIGYIAVLKLILHLTSVSNYGYFRDEFYYIACSEHLAFGYVDQPPLSIFLLALVRGLFGDSLLAIRFLPALAGATTVFLAGLMARQLGGGRFAQGLAALSVVAAPVLLGNSGRYFSMNAFDILFWALAAYTILLLIKNNNTKLWLIFGVIAGLGLMNKYSMLFFGIGLAGALLLTSHRKHLVSKEFWLGGLVAFGIFLPHIIWEIKHGFPSLEFMRNATQLKIASVSPLDFFLGQFREVGFANALLWLGGLIYLFFHRRGRPFRLFAWMYVLVLGIMVTRNVKIYYLSPIYPVLLAAGAVAIETSIGKINWNWLKPVVVSFIVAGGVIAAPFVIPVLPVETFIKYQSFLGIAPTPEERSELGELPQHYADMFGWEEMVATIAQVYRRLSPDEQADCIIYARNYGEAGAIDFFGTTYGLPEASCGHNNYWLWGPPKWSGTAAIIFGVSSDQEESFEDLRPYYKEVQHAATFTCKYCMPYENNRPIYICRGFQESVQDVWPNEKFFR